VAPDPDDEAILERLVALDLERGRIVATRRRLVEKRR